MLAKVTPKNSVVYILLFIIILPGGCSKETTSPEEVKIRPCEVIFNPQGPSFLKAINMLNSDVKIRNIGYGVPGAVNLPVGAIMNPGACELTGGPEGLYAWIVSKLPNGPEREITYIVAEGDTHTLEINTRFFGQ